MPRQKIEPAESVPSQAEGRLRRKLEPPMMVVRSTGEEGSKTLVGYAKNISGGGIMISSLNPKEPGSRLQVEMALPRPLNCIARCEAEVVWKRFYSKNRSYEPGMGLRFVDLPERTSAAIDEWIDREKRDSELYH